MGPAAHRRAADRAGAAHPLVQPVRPARRLAGDDAAQRGRRLVLLPAFLHGPAATRTARRSGRRDASRDFTPAFGICQWFHFEDHRLDDAVRWLQRLGVTLSAHRASAGPTASARTREAWFDRQMRGARAVRRDGDVLLHARASRAPGRTTPRPPQEPEEFAEFCAAMLRRYWRRRRLRTATAPAGCCGIGLSRGALPRRITPRLIAPVPRTAGGEGEGRRSKSAISEILATLAPGGVSRTAR